MGLDTALALSGPQFPLSVLESDNACMIPRAVKEEQLDGEQTAAGLER